MNTDGGLDNLIDLGFDGQICTVKKGYAGAALSSFITVLTGTVQQITVSWNRVTLVLKDHTSVFQTPCQTTHYLGNNLLPAGIEGTADIKDKPKPRLFGVCNNITPVCVNTSMLLYQVNYGAVFDITAVHDGGNVGQIVKGADYATVDLLMAAVMPGVTNPPTAPGSYATCLAQGFFRLDAAPFMQLTCDVIQGATPADRTAGQIIKTLAQELMGGNVAVQPILDLNAAAPYTVGVYSGDADVTYAALIDQLCASVGAWWGFDNLGIFWCKQLQAPDTTQALTTLTQNEIVSIDRAATADNDKGVPAWRVNIDYAKNWTVQTSGLAGSVAGNQLTFAPDAITPLTTDRKNLLGMAFSRAKVEDSSVQSIHSLSPEITLTTLLTNATDATTEATRVLNLRKTRRDRLTVKVQQQSIAYPIGGAWDNEAISEMPQARYFHSSVVYNNWLYVIGGIINGVASASVIRIDLSNPTSDWDDVGVADLPYALSESSAVIYNNKIYLVGGKAGASVYGSTMTLDLANPTAAWTQNAIANASDGAHRGHSCAVVGNILYLFGGYLNNGITPGNFANFIDLSVPPGTWNNITAAVYPIGASGIALVSFGQYIYGMGGIKAAGVVSNLASRFDTLNPTAAWDTTAIPDLPTPKHGATAVISGMRITIIGGLFSSTYTTTLPNVSHWDIGGVAWVDDAPLSTGRGYATSGCYNNSIYLIGGYLSGLTPIPNTWRLRSNSNPDDISHLTSLGRTILIQVPRYGYTTGRPMRIISVESDLQNGNITLDLWG